MAGLQSRASLRSAADDFDELYQGFDEASLLDTQKQVAEDAVLQRVTQSSRSGQANNGQGSRTRPESRIGVQTAKAIGRRSNGQQLFSANKTVSPAKKEGFSLFCRWVYQSNRLDELV
ncbi:hypothetical protein RvY_08732-3 [Ramazzottius varieornatus]|uniref:Uncharacterized protein n=1 Tax=Ramazzottius varieornatus TaxID=947166 RepID=A0A1D1V6W7_RAMVA|nr:hypothetical protein RvY_08732-3 [Ramazzottius varieornatus]